MEPISPNDIRTSIRPEKIEAEMALINDQLAKRGANMASLGNNEITITIAHSFNKLTAIEMNELCSQFRRVGWKKATYKKDSCGSVRNEMFVVYLFCENGETNSDMRDCDLRAPS